jgi:hypothetical protein
MKPAGAIVVLVMFAAGGAAIAQEQSEAQEQSAGQEQQAGSRVAVIEQQEAEKASSATPAKPGKVEQYVSKYYEAFLGGRIHWHPFFHNAYSGGGFTLGAGYATFVSPYNTLDVRGSVTFLGYKRIEAEFIDPQLFGRRGKLSAIGGWREATQVGFWGFGVNSPENARANYGFKQPYASATLEVRPTRQLLFVRGGLEFTQWKQ